MQSQLRPRHRATLPNWHAIFATAEISDKLNYEGECPVKDFAARRYQSEVMLLIPTELLARARY
jgi:hypothetical protein